MLSGLQLDGGVVLQVWVLVGLSLQVIEPFDAASAFTAVFLDLHLLLGDDLLQLHRYPYPLAEQCPPFGAYQIALNPSKSPCFVSSGEPVDSLWLPELDEHGGDPINVIEWFVVLLPQLEYLAHSLDVSLELPVALPLVGVLGNDLGVVGAVVEAQHSLDVVHLCPVAAEWAVVEGVPQGPAVVEAVDPVAPAVEAVELEVLLGREELEPTTVGEVPGGLVDGTSLIAGKR